MWKNRFGYVILQIQGLSLARVLQRMLRAGIPTSDVEHVNPTTIRLRIPASDFRKLLSIQRRERCKIHILERTGIFFWWRRVSHRMVLWLGIPLCTLCLWLFGMRIWFIQIDGAVRTDREMVLEMLAEHGIAVGKRPKGNVLILAADDLSAALPEAAWVSLNREGILLRVTMQELTRQHELVDWSVPANIIAKKDATIVSVQTRRGRCKVASGQAVKAGDILIAGHVVHREDRTTYDTRADGTVTGCCVYVAESDFSETVTEYQRTGNEWNQRQLLLWNLPVLSADAPFERYLEERTETISVSRFGIPIKLCRTVVSEIALKERVLTVQEQREQAELYALTDAIAMVPHEAAICSIHTVIQRDGERSYARCIVVTEESIGEIREMQHE